MNRTHPNPKPIVYVVSDSAGETAESVLKAAAIQFHPNPVDIRRAPYVVDRAGLDRVVADAAKEQAIVVFTLVVPELRDYLIAQTRKRKLVSIDLLGPIITTLEKAFNRESLHQPGLIHQLDEDYFKKVEAVEFAVKYDDGRDATGVLLADIVLVGVSRTSKTPLSMYLAHRKFKVANVPLVPELQPPEQLFTVSPDKVIGLVIDPDKLNMIRRERLKSLGLSDTALYAQVERINKELAYARDIMAKVGCKVIDVSNKAVEETAGIILGMLRR
ncbi:pyruvate, water dikinase regulatory protein [Paenibacillus flagellatus]|uniref:Putative pyruvate, phosphate dikinase regulatory protein n=1 Tax=Paenibacillus flagellatus TaxID=2211139 RepID=A0A2V5JYH1_9BACL|nr:pyruvate, water dikinase regulatory protein [Paenibacillus flagellatus]PYI51751.1 phosphoenolpyruvate synthase regulatory protein [Paenibacillus flagellatus]